MSVDEIRKKFEELPFNLIFPDFFEGGHFFYAFQSFHSWEKLRDKLFTTDMPKDELAYLRLTDLIYTIEGPFSFIMNVVIYSLLKEGHHDIWSESEQQFISSFEDIFKIPLYKRLKFLNAHNFSFFSDICPRKIRNAVAHQTFLIESNGIIKYNTTEISLSQIEKINDKMIKIAEIFFKVFEES